MTGKWKTKSAHRATNARPRNEGPNVQAAYSSPSYSAPQYDDAHQTRTTDETNGQTDGQTDGVHYKQEDSR